MLSALGLGFVAISIHAPVKGATPWQTLHWYAPWISIHAPVKGATDSLKEVGEWLDISIHAPVKGATAQ